MQVDHGHLHPLLVPIHLPPGVTLGCDPLTITFRSTYLYLLPALTATSLLFDVNNYNPCLRKDTIYRCHFRCHSMGPRATRDVEGSRPLSSWTLGSRQFAARLLSKYDHSLMKARNDFSQQQGRWAAGRTLGWGFLPRGQSCPGCLPRPLHSRSYSIPRRWLGLPSLSRQKVPWKLLRLITPDIYRVDCWGHLAEWQSPRDCTAPSHLGRLGASLAS